MSEEQPQSKVVAFMESKYAVPAGLALALVLSAFLLTLEKDGALCMATLLIAVAGYIIPRNFGLRDIKKLMVWGVAFVMIVTSMAFVFTWSYYEDGASGPVSDDDGLLVDGGVSPYRTADDGVYNYTVTVKGNLSDVEVHVGVIEVMYLEAGGGDLLENHSMTKMDDLPDGGAVYSALVPLEGGEIYFFYFSAEDAEDEHETAHGEGPNTMDGPAAAWFYFSQNFNNIFTLVGLPYFFLAFISWWMRRNIDKAVERMEEQGRIPPRDGRPCVKCKTPLGKDEETCPGCGREIPQYVPPPQLSKEEPEPKDDEFVCSECGAVVDDEAPACPSCGEEFED